MFQLLYTNIICMRDYCAIFLIIILDLNEFSNRMFNHNVYNITQYNKYIYSCFKNVGNTNIS